MGCGLGDWYWQQRPLAFAACPPWAAWKGEEQAGAWLTLSALCVPAAPPKEPVLMCRSNNYPKRFYCSWHLPSPTYIPNTFNISVM